MSKPIAKMKRLNGTTMSLNRPRANHERLRNDRALLSPRPIPSRLPNITSTKIAPENLGDQSKSQLLDLS